MLFCQSMWWRVQQKAHRGQLIFIATVCTWIQWATLVTHHFFRAHIFWQKCKNWTFSIIIYLMTFYQNHSCESFCYVKGNFDKKCTCNLNVYVFYLHFGDRCDRKNIKNYYFIQAEPLFAVVEFSNTITFWSDARFDVILTSVKIIKQVFLRKLFCYESLVDIEVSKH